MSDRIVDADMEDGSPPCIECGRSTELVTGRDIYPHRPDLHDRNFWQCLCGAYCGTHRGTTASLGYPCGGVTREARKAAHAAFDQLWRGPQACKSRSAAYRWLAREMGLHPDNCHIGTMNAAQAREVARLSTLELEKNCK